MTAAIRQLFFLGIATALSWWFLLRPPTSGEVLSVPQAAAGPIEVRTQVASAAAASAPASEPAPEQADPEPSEPTPAPPPPELGTPEGKPDPELPDNVTPPEQPEPADVAEEQPTENSDQSSLRSSMAQLRADSDLLEEARRDFAGETRQGFATVLLASPEDQLDLARTFGEQLVLVPRSALDPEGQRPFFYRLRLEGAGSVERVDERPDLESYRQYRDLFDYEYNRLPEPVRELRRSVLSRDEIYLFGALIPVSEWAVVLGRRQEALERLGADPTTVRRFVLRYARLGDGSFDLRVEEIEFADGRRKRLS